MTERRVSYGRYGRTGHPASMGCAVHAAGRSFGLGERYRRLIGQFDENCRRLGTSAQAVGELAEPRAIVAWLKAIEQTEDPEAKAFGRQIAVENGWLHSRHTSIEQGLEDAIAKYGYAVEKAIKRLEKHQEVVEAVRHRFMEEISVPTVDPPEMPDLSTEPVSVTFEVDDSDDDEAEDEDEEPDDEPIEASEVEESIEEPTEAPLVADGGRSENPYDKIASRALRSNRR